VAEIQQKSGGWDRGVEVAESFRSIFCRVLVFLMQKKICKKTAAQAKIGFLIKQLSI